MFMILFMVVMAFVLPAVYLYQVQIAKFIEASLSIFPEYWQYVIFGLFAVLVWALVCWFFVFCIRKDFY